MEDRVEKRRSRLELEAECRGGDGSQNHKLNLGGLAAPGEAMAWLENTKAAWDYTIK